MIIVSQYTASLYDIARKCKSDKKDIPVVTGFINREPVTAIDDGHHTFMAARLNGDTPKLNPSKHFKWGDEEEFIHWLKTHTKEGPWFDITTGEYVREALA